MGMLHNVAEVDRKIRQNAEVWCETRHGLVLGSSRRGQNLAFLRKMTLKVEARDQILDHRLKFPGENGQKWVKTVAIVSVTVKLGFVFLN